MESLSTPLEISNFRSRQGGLDFKARDIYSPL